MDNKYGLVALTRILEDCTGKTLHMEAVKVFTWLHPHAVTVGGSSVSMQQALLACLFYVADHHLLQLRPGKITCSGCCSISWQITESEAHVLRLKAAFVCCAAAQAARQAALEPRRAPDRR